MKRICRLTLAICTSAFFLLSCASTDDPELVAVDRAIARADRAQDSIAASIAACIDSLESISSPQTQFRQELEIADRYMSFDLLQALSHLETALKIARIHSPSDTTEVLLKIASLYNSQGKMIKEATDIFESINSAKLNRENKLRYYILGVQISRNLQELAIAPTQKQKYGTLLSGYRDSVLGVAPSSFMIAVNKMLDAGETSAAEALMLRELEKTSDTLASAPVYHVLAQIYAQQGQYSRHRHFLIRAATADLSNGVREYKALSELAIILLAEGDVERAYRYIHRSADDAEASNAYLRQTEVAPLLAVIDAAYMQVKERRALTMAMIGGLMLLIICVILFSYIMLRRKNHRLRAFAEELHSANCNLKDAIDTQRRLNGIIAEESNVKQTYIMAFMELCLVYLQKMERFRAELNKIAAKRDINSLTKAISSSRYVNREVAEFYTRFDDAFLQLYPDFIEKLNSLLKEEYRFAKSTEFTTELRIYALIRLGIRSSGDIARFLRCSDSTIYNYRTLMRNKSLDRGNFEAQVALL